MHVALIVLDAHYGAMANAGTHALLKTWTDAVVPRGVYGPDSTHTLSWASVENPAWSILNTPYARVKVIQPNVAPSRRCLTTTVIAK